MPIMIWLAAIIEAAIGNYIDMGILLFILFANAGISFYETNKAGDAVAALKASLKPEACVYRDGKWQQTDASLLVPGDLVLLSCGAAVPADCRVNSGTIDVDQAQLTGESLPVTMYKGSPVMMGSTVARGECEGTVEFTGLETFCSYKVVSNKFTASILGISVSLSFQAFSVRSNLIFSSFILDKNLVVILAVSFIVKFASLRENSFPRFVKTKK
jgi:H+-transporting ATPase